jgi:hypothetical protein
MAIPTLVVSDPPHGEVDLDAAAKLLQLDPFATRLKAVFAAPEVMEAAGVDEASEFAEALRRAGFNVVVLPGAVLAEVPWPEPVSTLTLDAESLRMTTRTRSHRISYEADVLGVYCRPPQVPARTSTVQIERAIASEHGPTIAYAIHRRTILDLYFLDAGSLRRATIVPELLELDAERVVRDLRRRFERLRLDDRLAGIRPRLPYQRWSDGSDGSERRRYSFGTLMLYRALDSIAPELRAVPQYELGSRLAYALSPPEGAAPAR